ncbi:MerR family transcriptional regulator [Nannocystaceae bacterium ST9]
MSSTKSKPRGADKPSASLGGDAPDLGTDKLYFKIGEVAEIVGVAAHVLRYWESEFPTIKPHKSRSQQRVYRRKDVETLLKIKHLLYDRKFTIAGARQELRKGADKVESAPVSGPYKARQSLARVREQLDLLAAAIRSEDRAPISADPASFVRSSGGAEALRAASEPGQPLLERPVRTDRLDVE